MASNLNRQLLISFLIIVASIIAAIVAFYILTNTVTSTAAGIVSDKALAQEQAGALGVVAQLKQEAPRAAAYQAAMDQLLPTQDGLIGFSEWISKVAATNQVSATVSFQSNAPVVPINGSRQEGFSLLASGNIGGLIGFLSDIESKVPGFMLQINSLNLINQGGNYQLTGQGQLFFH